MDQLNAGGLAMVGCGIKAKRFCKVGWPTACASRP